MPTPTIPAGNLFMNATLWTGNGSTQTITNGASGASFQPDLVWGKARSAATSNEFYDSIRGVSKSLLSNTTGAENNWSPYGVTAFNTNGFSVNDIASSGYGINETGVTYVGWQWKAGGTAVSNTDGTITSSVSANQTSGFSVVTYTGTGSNGSVGHGLGAVPKMIIIKSRSNTSDWIVYNSNLTSASYRLFLSDTSGQDLSTTTFNSTAPTSTVFSLGTNANVNSSGWTQVAYCWAPIAGYSAFGSYTGNGSADGPFVYTGFRPRFLLVKRTDSGGDWNIVDTSRNTSNVANLELFPNDARSETTGGGLVADLNSNGFKIRTSDSFYNASGSTQIYAAFAENPFKYANAR
jgi:hypothetical protein